MDEEKRVLKVSGIMKLPNDFECDELDVSGILKVKGDVNTKLLSNSGIVTITGNIKANTISTSGILRITESIEVSKMKMAGMLKTQSIIGEEVEFSGRLKVFENINCEKFIFKISSNSTVNCIEGSEVKVESRKRSKKLKVNTISADKIEIENVKCDTISGNVVKIGSGCQIKNVIYNTSLEIAPSAHVKNKTKVE